MQSNYINMDFLGYWVKYPVPTFRSPNGSSTTLLDWKFNKSNHFNSEKYGKDTNTDSNRYETEK